MRRAMVLQAGILAGALIGGLTPFSRASITADQVLSYTPGTVHNSYWGDPYTVPTAALGLPDLTQNVPDKFDSGGNQIAFADNSAITPFNASYNPQQVVAIANGGSLTLHLSAPIEIGPGAALGIHSAAGLEDANPGQGQNLNPAANYTGSRSADLLVSPDDMHWIDLGDRTFNNPTNIYADMSDPYGGHTGMTLANFDQPFLGDLHSFDGKNWTQTLAALNGSAGGNWVDLSSTSAPQVNFVRLTTAPGETMFVDAVVGNSAVPEPGAWTCLFAAIALSRRRR